MDQMWSNTIILNDWINPTRGDFISNWKHIDIVYTYVECRLYWEERERKPLCDISNRITSAAALSQQVMALPMPPIDGICATTIIHIFPCFALLVSLLKAQSHQSITEEFGQKYCGSNLRAASFTLQFVSSSAPSPQTRVLATVCILLKLLALFQLVSFLLTSFTAPTCLEMANLKWALNRQNERFRCFWYFRN